MDQPITAAGQRSKFRDVEITQIHRLILTINGIGRFGMIPDHQFSNGTRLTEIQILEHVFPCPLRLSFSYTPQGGASEGKAA